MESRTPRPASARTNCIAVPGLFLGLSKLCKLTKVCAAPPPGCDAGGSAKLPGSGNAGGYDEKLVEVILLEAIGALKSAYVKLQRAHVPYNPAKIAVADEVVASELDSVAALRCLCGTSGGVGGGVGKLIDERWSLVQELEGETRKRESDIVVLRRELEELRRASSRLGEQIKMSRASVRRCKAAFVPRQLTTTATATPGAFLELFMAAAAAAVQGFAELISASLTPAAASSSSDRCTGNAVELCRGRYSLEAHLWRTMLGGDGGTGEEEEEMFDAARFDRIMRRPDPLDALAEQHPSSGRFARFCRSRYLTAVSPETERALFGNLDQRAFVSRGGHPRTWSYRAFATAARATWALRVAMASRSDGVRMFYARGGSRYSAEHMRSAAAAVGREGEDEKLGVVAFTVAPGLSVGGAVAVACRVFLCDLEDADDVQ